MWIIFSNQNEGLVDAKFLIFVIDVMQFKSPTQLICPLAGWAGPNYHQTLAKTIPNPKKSQILG